MLAVWATVFSQRPFMAEYVYPLLHTGEADEVVTFSQRSLVAE
ncbi:hypothetical protein [Shewanella sp. SM96]|nr:hypothetical protein [Shewanella sp. SM96]